MTPFMNFKAKLQNLLSKETVVHLFFWILYFVVISYRKGYPQLQFADCVLTLNYFFLIILINYWLIPRFFYRKKYLTFLSLGFAAIALFILIEEFVLEQLFFPNTYRASKFPGFLFNLKEIGPVVLLFMGVKLAWDNLQQQSKMEQLEKEKVENQLQLLKSQLHPHFLFNNLNNLYAYTQEASPKAPEIILQLSAILRYMLYESQDNFVPLKKELDYLQDYIRLQELHMESRGKVHYRIDGNTGSRQIAPLILIGFVENCFKHSLASQAENILIDISAEILDNVLSFRCVNTYSRLSGSPNQHLPRGLGFANVKKRLSLLYPGKHQLEHYSKEGMYFVYLKLTLQTNANSS